MNPKKLEQKCSNCFKVKPVDEFYKKLERHQSRCKSCNAEVVRSYQSAKRFKDSRAHYE